jgi:hypothetical protein
MTNFETCVTHRRILGAVPITTGKASRVSGRLQHIFDDMRWRCMQPAAVSQVDSLRPVNSL